MKQTSAQIEKRLAELENDGEAILQEGEDLRAGHEQLQADLQRAKALQQVGQEADTEEAQRRVDAHQVVIDKWQVIADKFDTDVAEQNRLLSEAQAEEWQATIRKADSDHAKLLENLQDATDAVIEAFADLDEEISRDTKILNIPDSPELRYGTSERFFSRLVKRSPQWIFRGPVKLVVPEHISDEIVVTDNLSSRMPSEKAA